MKIKLVVRLKYPNNYDEILNNNTNLYYTIFGLFLNKLTNKIW